MLSCKELVARSSDFLDGQLDFRGQLAVRSHLLMCRHCRRFIRQMRLTQATVRHLPEGQGPELDRLAAHLSELRKDAAPTDISPAGAIPEFRQRDGKFFSTPL